MRAAVVLAAAVGCSALAAALHPAPRDAYRALGSLVIEARTSPAAVAIRTRQAADVFRSAGVVGQALDEAQQPTPDLGRTLRRIHATPRPRAGVVDFAVSGSTPATAEQLARALADVTGDVLRSGPDANHPGVRVIGDFESGGDDWFDAGGAAHSDSRVVPGGRFGGRALGVSCRPRCGVLRVLQGPFRAGARVTVSLWARSRARTALAVRLGAAHASDASQPVVVAGPSWRRFVVSWRPAKTVTLASIVVTNDETRPVRFALDGVLLTRARAVAPAREERIFSGRDVLVVTPVRAVAARGRATEKWAVAGALVGAVMGLIGVLAWSAARRRAAVAPPQPSR